MPGVSLRDYGDEVRELVKADSNEEAIAICQHILRQYPKYVEAYRLLGEACLELGKPREAGDFFRRVLSADPEDVIAHVGLSMLFEDQEALDEAVWQMERAFELAPSNAEIRKELQRLYESRDGVERSRLKLTQGGLARLYVQGGLYPQAINRCSGRFGRSILARWPTDGRDGGLL
jgi:tetratricopeptide (TPR) repeat protein